MAVFVNARHPGQNHSLDYYKQHRGWMPSVIFRFKVRVRSKVKYVQLCRKMTFKYSKFFFMPPKELWEAYSNRTVRSSVRQSVRPALVSGPYLLNSLR